MSLARSFTKRFQRADDHGPKSSAAPALSFAARFQGSKSKLPQISLPVNLLSTSNMNLYNNPDIADAQKMSLNNPIFAANDQYRPQTPTRRSGDSASSAAPTTPTTPGTDAAPTLTDASSVESSPTVEYNHLSCYFPGSTTPKRSQSARFSSTAAAPDLDPIDEFASPKPAIPQRAASHSKREHERLARKRSIRNSSDSHGSSARLSSNPSTPALSRSASVNHASDSDESNRRSSFDIIGRSGGLLNRSASASKVRSSPTSPVTATFAGPPTPRTLAHPFSQELEQLNEVAEDFNGVAKLIFADSDAELMLQRGLVKYSVDDYLSEIIGLRAAFDEQDGSTRVANLDSQACIADWF